MKKIIEQLKNESKQNLPEFEKISKDSTKYYKEMNSISKPILIELLKKTIEKIDELQNPFEYDERDALDQLCDCEFIFENLVNSCIEDCELWLNEDSNEGK